MVFELDGPYLGSRLVANRYRLAIEEVLRADPRYRVMVSFKNVTGVGHSFVDEILTPLHEMLGDELSTRVTFTELSREVWEAVRATCVMHDLPEPSYECDVQLAA